MDGAIEGNKCRQDDASFADMKSTFILAFQPIMTFMAIRRQTRPKYRVRLFHTHIILYCSTRKRPNNIHFHSLLISKDYQFHTSVNPSLNSRIKITVAVFYKQNPSCFYTFTECSFSNVNSKILVQTGKSEPGKIDKM